MRNLKTTAEDNTSHRLYEYLSSVRLTILLCIALAAASVIGTLIPQNEAYEQYLARYGIKLTNIFQKLDLLDLYHSLWFVGLLALLALNLVVCTVRKFPRVWRNIHREKQPPTEASLEKWRHVATFPFRGDPAIVDKTLQDILGNVFGKPRRVDRSGLILYGVDKGRYARYGPYITHVSVFLILVGAVVGSILGFKGMVAIPEGGQIDSVQPIKSEKSRPLGFVVQCNRFVLTQYPDGTPKDYRSDLVLKDLEGKTILEGAVRVNHPLAYKGITFYQATYGATPELTLSVHDNKTGKVTNIKTKLNTPFVLSKENGDRAMVVNFETDFQMPAEMARAMSAPRRGLGSAAQLVVLKEKGNQDVFWIFKEFPNFSKDRENAYLFQIVDYTTSNYTGLQVVKDPGNNVVWAGCILMVLGFILSFFFDHEILWVALLTDKDRGMGRVTVAGRTIRHPSSYESRFGRILQAFEKQLSPFLLKKR